MSPDVRYSLFPSENNVQPLARTASKRSLSSNVAPASVPRRTVSVRKSSENELPIKSCLKHSSKSSNELRADADRAVPVKKEVTVVTTSPVGKSIHLESPIVIQTSWPTEVTIKPRETAMLQKQASSPDLYSLPSPTMPRRPSPRLPSGAWSKASESLPKGHSRTATGNSDSTASVSTRKSRTSSLSSPTIDSPSSIYSELFSSPLFASPMSTFSPSVTYPSIPKQMSTPPTSPPKCALPQSPPRRSLSRATTATDRTTSSRATTMTAQTNRTATSHESFSTLTTRNPIPHQRLASQTSSMNEKRSIFPTYNFDLSHRQQDYQPAFNPLSPVPSNQKHTTEAPFQPLSTLNLHTHQQQTCAAQATSRTTAYNPATQAPPSPPHSSTPAPHFDPPPPTQIAFRRPSVRSTRSAKSAATGITSTSITLLPDHRAPSRSFTTTTTTLAGDALKTTSRTVPEAAPSAAPELAAEIAVQHGVAVALGALAFVAGVGVEAVSGLRLRGRGAKPEKKGRVGRKLSKVRSGNEVVEETEEEKRRKLFVV